MSIKIGESRLYDLDQVSAIHPQEGELHVVYLDGGFRFIIETDEPFGEAERLAVAVEEAKMPTFDVQTGSITRKALDFAGEYPPEDPTGSISVDFGETKTEEVLREIKRERGRQNDIYGPEHDSQHAPLTWFDILKSQLYKARASLSQGEKEESLRYIKQLAAVAVAFLEQENQ